MSRSPESYARTRNISDPTSAFGEAAPVSSNGRQKEMIASLPFRSFSCNSYSSSLPSPTVVTPTTLPPDHGTTQPSSNRVIEIYLFGQPSHGTSASGGVWVPGELRGSVNPVLGFIYRPC